MKALVCVAPGRLILEERSEPSEISGEILVKIRRVGICGTDYHIYQGNQPFLSYPRVMGHELAVEVVANATGHGPAIGDVCVVNPYLSCGTCVACRRGKPNCCARIAVLGVHRDGGMTQLLSLPPANLISAPGLTADECAMVEFLAIGAHAVRRGDVGSIDRVLIVGAGPIGLGAALFASLSGAHVTVSDRDATRLAAARTLVPGSATIVADAQAREALHAATDGEGFDVVFDATGSGESIEGAFDYVAHGGRYVLVSVVKGNIAFADADFHRREMTLVASRNAIRPDFERVIAAIRDGKATARQWLTHRTSLADATNDLPRWASEKAGLVKAVIEIE